MFIFTSALIIFSRSKSFVLSIRLFWFSFDLSFSFSFKFLSSQFHSYFFFQFKVLTFVHFFYFYSFWHSFIHLISINVCYLVLFFPPKYFFCQIFQSSVRLNFICIYIYLFVQFFFQMCVFVLYSIQPFLIFIKSFFFLDHRDRWPEIPYDVIPRWRTA